MHKSGDYVTLNLNSKASNTFIYKGQISENEAILSHPLGGDTCILAPVRDLNTVNPNLKDSTERSLDYVNRNKRCLDYNSKMDLECLSIYFASKRKLSPNMKKVLANLSGIVASAEFKNDIRSAMEFITANKSCLDEFNMMWFNNFKGLFDRSQSITSDKQTKAIYNIAGFVLAELATPSTIQKI